MQHLHYTDFPFCLVSSIMCFRFSMYYCIAMAERHQASLHGTLQISMMMMMMCANRLQKLCSKSSCTNGDISCKTVELELIKKTSK